MGVDGLWDLLEPSATPITLDALEGKKLAVDISIWLHQAAYDNGKRSWKSQISKHPHLTLLINRISKLLFYKIRPVFVFDGSEIPEFKRQILRERAIARHLDELSAAKISRRQLLDQFLQSAENNLNSSNSTNCSWESEESTDLGNQKQQNKRKLKLGHKRLFEQSNVSGAQKEKLFELPKMSPSRVQASSSNDHLGISMNFSNEEKNEVAVFSSTKNESIYDKIESLREAKERAKQERLQPEEIPQDSLEFSSFQMQRLLKRRKIDSQIEGLQANRLKRSLLASNPNLVGTQKFTKITDSLLNTHFLAKNNSSSSCSVPDGSHQSSSSAKALEIDETLEGYTMDLQKESRLKNDKHASGSFDSNKDKNRDGDEDDDLQQAIFASLYEQNKNRNKSILWGKQAAFADSSAEAEFVDQLNASEEFADGIASSDEDDSDGFIDVPDIDPFPNDSADTTQQDIIILNEESDGVFVEEGYFLPKASTSNGFGFSKISENNKKIEEEEQQGVYADCQKLLALLGLPFMQATGEAEAQCVELERLGLVDAVISDDSDVWPFGAQLVYRHMFSRRKHVQEYKAVTILRNSGLSRSEFIQLALIAGGDYTKGLANVGIVTGVELITEFADSKCFVDESTTSEKNSSLEQNAENCEALKSLKRISAWLCASSAPTTNAEGANKVDRKEKLKKTIKAANDDESLKLFPNPQVFSAYAKPAVNSSRKRFHWSRIDFPKLNVFLMEKLGMDEQMLNKKTFDAFKRWDDFLKLDVEERQYQTRISAFMRPTSSFEPNQMEPDDNLPSNRPSRVKAALEKLKSLKQLQ